MASFEDQKAATQTAIDDVKAAIIAKVGAAEARAADAEKKLVDAAASAVSLDELEVWSNDVIAKIKGMVE